MTRRTAYLLLFFCLLGLAASLGSAWVHYQLLRGDPNYAPFCSISATWNCETVYESRFGAFRGVPVALAGVIWFGAATLLSLAGLAAARAPLPSGRKKTAPAVRPGAEIGAYLFALSVVGLSVVLYFGYASFFILKTVCILCVT